MDFIVSGFDPNGKVLFSGEPISANCLDEVDLVSKTRIPMAKDYAKRQGSILARIEIYQVDPKPVLTYNL